ncbi:MAG: DedA family protein [bacterium]|nr:DedA family protein [bacterium]
MVFSDSQVIALVLQYKYAILLPIAFVEGPMIMFFGGILYRLGYFELLPLYFTLLIGDLIADFFWYGLGYYASRPLLKKYGHWFSINEEVFQKIERLFHRHQNKILFISKITMGFGFALATLIAAGAAKVPFKKYAVLNLLGGFIWTGLLLALGYFFGNLYGLIGEQFRLLSLVAAAVLLFSVLYGVRRYLRERLLRNKL